MTDSTMTEYSSKRARIGPTGIDHEPHPLVGGLSHEYGCKMRYGRKRPMSMAKVMKNLLNREVYWFSSLIQGGGFPGPPTWRIQGSYDLRYHQLPAAGGFDIQIDLPVYVFRLNAATGAMLNAATIAPGSQPVIAYRLRAFQPLAGNNYFYRWVQAPPTNNGPTTSTLNVWKKIITESQPLAGPEIYQEYAKLEALFTGAGILASDVSMDIVRFNNDYSAPPDQYYQNDNTTFVTYSKNSGSDQLPGTLAAPDLDNDLQNSKFYNNWLARARCHPLANGVMVPGTVGSKPFTVLRKCRCGLSSKTTENASTLSNQIKFSATENYYKWMNTAAVGNSSISGEPGLGPDANFTNFRPITVNKNVGVFPEPTKQRWLMISSFSRLNNSLEQAYDANWDCTFDIRIQAAFSAAVQPLVSA